MAAEAEPTALADSVPFDGRSPRESNGEGTRVIVRAVARSPRGGMPATALSEPFAL